MSFDLLGNDFEPKKSGFQNFQSDIQNVKKEEASIEQSWKLICTVLAALLIGYNYGNMKGEVTPVETPIVALEEKPVDIPMPTSNDNVLFLALKESVD